MSDMELFVLDVFLFTVIIASGFCLFVFANSGSGISVYCLVCAGMKI